MQRAFGESAIIQPQPTYGGAMATTSIFIVDDEPNQRFILEQALSMLAGDWQIFVAATAHEALDQIARYSPDVIITDYHMPEMNGIELAEQVRAMNLNSHIILITAYTSPEVISEAKRLGIQHYLTKPVPLTTLRRLTLSLIAGAASSV
jgi:CheY-like chemotaxis protein